MRCCEEISIHAPRVGRDLPARLRLTSRLYFNPRAPCGARLAAFLLFQMFHVFQSTRPVWGATFKEDKWAKNGIISIHAPRVGRDKACLLGCILFRYFNPRAPCGARQELRTNNVLLLLFQSTRPVWGATKPNTLRLIGGTISIHAPRVGRDHLQHQKCFHRF